MPHCQSLVCSIVCLLCLLQSVQAVELFCLERLGQYQPVGDLFSYDSANPTTGTYLGATGLKKVGAIDFYEGRLWAASAASNVLRFWQIDPTNAQATLISTAVSHTQDYVFGGTFDNQGHFWVTDLEAHTLASYDPWTGQQISSVSIAPDLIATALAFVGDTLYALAYQNGGWLGTLDTTTGTFAQIASNGRIGGSNGLDFDPASGKLLATLPSGNPVTASALWQFDPSNGSSQLIAVVNPLGTYDAIAVVPEPSSIALALLGASCLVRRGRRVRTR